MKRLRRPFKATRMAEHGEQELMEVAVSDLAPDPDLTLLRVPTPQPGTSPQAPKSLTKNYKFYWVEKVDNSYSPPTQTARSIPQSVHALGVGAAKKRKRMETDCLIK